MSEFVEEYSQFLERFGMILYDMCNGGKLSYDRKLDNDSKVIKGYDLQKLTMEEINALIKKSVETGTDYLYEAVKDEVYIFPEGCFS